MILIRTASLFVKFAASTFMSGRIRITHGQGFTAHGVYLGRRVQLFNENGIAIERRNGYPFTNRN